MAIEGDLQSFLAADANVSSRASTRIWNLRAPQNEERPFVILQRISTNRRYSHDGDVQYTTVRMQVDSYADSDAEALALADDIRSALAGKFGFGMGGTTARSAFTVDEETFWSNEANLYRVRQDHMISVPE